jgi:hypothetical protein
VDDPPARKRPVHGHLDRYDPYLLGSTTLTLQVWHRAYDCPPVIEMRAPRFYGPPRPR